MKFFFTFILAFILGVVTALSYTHYYDSKRKVVHGREIREMGDYRFINPLLECEMAGRLAGCKKENFKQLLTLKFRH